MDVLEGYFTDVDIYNEYVKNWDLKFTVLSKSDFSAKLKMVSNEKFSLVREILTGKIDQKGKTQKDFIVFGFAVNNTSYYWFDKKADTNNLVIFPKGNNFNVVSYDNYDVFVLSVHHDYFFKLLSQVGANRFNSVYDGNAQLLFLSKAFASRFTNLLDYFLNTDLQNNDKNNALIETIVLSLIRYLEETNEKETIIEKNKTESAVKMAVNIIKNQNDQLFSIKQLCVMVGVSERALLYGFKEKFRVSPSEYIKAYRLNRVKNEIYTSPNTPIFEIASKYHFWHMGQFAKDFKKQFGVLPSQIRGKNLG